jgi:hypothetical protein
MQTVTIPQIVERIQHLSGTRLLVVYNFVFYLVDREGKPASGEDTSEAWQTIVADESGQADWYRLSEQTLANAYGAEEPQYALDAIKELNPEYARRWCGTHARAAS